MTFAKNVQKYSKWVLGGIVALLAISMVVSGNVGDTESGEATRPVATIFGSVTVTAKDWRDAQAKAGAWFRLKVVRDVDTGVDHNFQQMAPYLFSFRDQPGMLAWHEPFKPTPEDWTANAKELIILGRYARDKQVRVTDDEVDELVRGFLDRAAVPQDAVDRHASFSQTFFLASPETFRSAVRDWLTVEKALNLDVGGSNVRWATLFEEKMGAARSVKVLVAGIDGTQLPGDIAKVSDEEIRNRFERDRDKYKMPGKAKVEYLMIAFDDLKSRMKEPAADEIKKYYEDHKREFIKPAQHEEGHSEGDGHDHGPAKEEFKAQEEVRDEIVKKIKDQQASREAWALISKISSKDYGDHWQKIYDEEKAREPKDAASVKQRTLARTESVLYEIKKKYAAEGVELRNAITRPFDENDRDVFFDEVGKSTAHDPLDWAFSGPVGEVGIQIYKSEKGFALLRIAGKTEGYETDLTAPIREKIRQDITRDQAAGRSRRLADELVKNIQANGAQEIARLRDRKDLKIQHSLYMTQATPDTETGLAPSLLSQQVKSKILKAPDPRMPTQAPAGDVQAIYGEAIGGDKKDWSYVVVVEDQVQTSPEIRDEDFLADVRRKEAEELAKKRADQAQRLVSGAEWKDAKDSAPAQ